MTWWPLVAIQAMDINTALSYGWTMDPGKVLGSSLDMDVNMTLIGSVAHSNWHGPSSSVAIEHIYGPRCGPRYPVSTWSSDGNRILRHQQRPWLQQCHGPRHGPSHSLYPNDAWCLLAVHVTQICMDLAFNTALQHQHGYSTRHSPLATAWTHMSLWP